MKDLFGLEVQPALVVGGGYGRGRLTAILLARAGARVAVAEGVPLRRFGRTEETAARSSSCWPTCRRT